MNKVDMIATMAEVYSKSLWYSTYIVRRRIISMKKQQSKQSRLVRHNDTCCSHSTNLFDRAETPKLLPDADGKNLLHLPTQYLRDAERRSLNCARQL